MIYQHTQKTVILANQINRYDDGHYYNNKSTEFQCLHDRSILGGNIDEQFSLTDEVASVRTLKCYGLVRGGVHQPIHLFILLEIKSQIA